MFLSPNGRAILKELRHGPLNPYELASELDLAPFTVRGELYALRRIRLVRERTSSSEHTWELTSRGQELAWTDLQLEMEPKAEWR
jgi:DNA-binding transcriptional ArsR family regulator